MIPDLCIPTRCGASGTAELANVVKTSEEQAEAGGMLPADHDLPFTPITIIIEVGIISNTIYLLLRFVDHVTCLGILDVLQVATYFLQNCRITSSPDF